MYLANNRRVYKLSSVAGLRKWVDYIPVKTLSAATLIDLFDDDGAGGVDILSSVTGLRAWVDYIPVYETASGTAWSYDDDGYLPIKQSGAAALWTPAEITTALWLDASDDTTFTLDGSAVDQWDDKSGRNNHASQSVAASKPTKVTDGVQFAATSNTSPGSADRLEISLMVLQGYPFSSFAVVDNVVETYNPVILGSQAAATSYFAHGCDYLQHRNTTARTINYSPEPTWTGTERNMVYAELNSATDRQGRLNGGAATTDVVSSPDLSTGGTTYIGDRSEPSVTYPSNPLIGIIREIVVVDQAADETTRQKVEGYLAHRWGFEDKLPGAHPYKTEAPTL